MTDRPRVAQARFTKAGRLRPWAHARVPQPRVALGTTRRPIVPLVSSDVAGPLGLVHFPRMWLEGMLAGAGRLDPGFARGRPLFDAILCDVAQVDEEALRAFLRGAPAPDYADAEAWLVAHARRLDDGAIALINAAVRKAAVDGAPLAMTDDLRAWSAVHAAVVAAPAASIEPVVPAISTRTAGPLGADHLPRLWLKNLLKARGALPSGYRSGAVRIVERGLATTPGGIDATAYRNLGLDMPATVAFIESTLPDYPAFEDYVRRSAHRLDVASIARHNATYVDTRPGKADLEKAYVRWQSTSRWSYLIDDLIDWRVIYDILTGGELPDWAGPLV